jgi:hypothetical protein
MHTKHAELRIQHEIANQTRCLEFIHTNRATLEALDLKFMFFSDYIDFDNLDHSDVIRVIKAFPGTWNKYYPSDNGGITYALAEPVTGFTVRCYNGTPPPVRRISK